MSYITLITGGQRSGKSTLAKNLAEQASDVPICIATARAWDNDFSQRIERHRLERGEHWRTIEESKYISQYDLTHQTVLLDCITLWLTNFFADNDYDVAKALEEAKLEWDRFVQQSLNLIVVTNEIGMGVHGEHEVSRKFADLQGWMNQYISSQADKVLLMVSGISVVIKP